MLVEKEKEIGSYRLTLDSAFESSSEFEYDSMYELCNSYMEHKERQYKVRAFIDYVDGETFEMSSEEVRQELKILGVLF